MASARPASEGSGRQQESRDGQSRFVIPPAIDNFDDVPSPSQHRLSFASQRRQACLDSFSHDQDQDDAYYSEEEDEGDVEASNSSGGEEEQEEEEEAEESENSEEEERHGDVSQVATSRAPSKQPSSRNHVAAKLRTPRKRVQPKF